MATPGGFWIRLAALLVDSAVLTAGMMFAALALPGVSLADFGPEEFNGVDMALYAGAALYDTLLVWMFSTTVGKRAFGLYVQRPDGSRVGLIRAFARHIAEYISFFLFCIGYIMIGLSANKRGLHDLICGTVVVKRRSRFYNAMRSPTKSARPQRHAQPTLSNRRRGSGSAAAQSANPPP